MYEDQTGQVGTEQKINGPVSHAKEFRPHYSTRNVEQLVLGMGE